MFRYGYIIFLVNRDTSAIADTHHSLLSKTNRTTVQYLMQFTQPSIQGCRFLLLAFIDIVLMYHLKTPLSVFMSFAINTCHPIVGVYGCKLAQNQLPVGISNKLATLQSTIKIQACNRNAALVSNTIVLTFLPPMVLVTKELYLSSSEPMAFIEIGATSESIKRMFIKV